MTFEVGDKVIYPNHGLGIVERIEEKTILGTTCGFYHLRIVANETTVLVPLVNQMNPSADVLALVGLQGSGKTTTCGKLARMVKEAGWNFAEVADMGRQLDRR